MSITRNVPLRPWFRAPCVLIGALVLVAAPGVATAGTASAGVAQRSPVGTRPARAPGSDPLTRIAALSALVGEREQAAIAAQTRRDGTVAEFGRARLAENLALARADLLS